MDRVMEDLAIGRPWRTGRKLGRTVYVQVGPEPSDDDLLIGMMDTPEIATEAAGAHNVAGGWPIPAPSPPHLRNRPSAPPYRARPWLPPPACRRKSPPLR